MLFLQTVLVYRFFFPHLPESARFLFSDWTVTESNSCVSVTESQCRRTSPDLTTQQLDTLKNICQTHTRPRTRDAECRTPDFLRPKFEAANQVEEGMEHRAEESSKTVIPSINSSERPSSPENSGRDREDPGSVSCGALAEEAVNQHEKAEGGAGHTTAVIGNGLHPCTAGGMDQSISAEQQGQDLDSAQKTETDVEEERDVEGAVGALEMEDEEEEEEEEEEENMERESSFCKKALPVETLVSGTAVELQVLHQDELHQEMQDKETQLCHKTHVYTESADVCLEPEAPISHEFNGRQQDPQAEELLEEELLEEEEEEDYDEDVMREAPLLDNMAKLISIEEMSPASGLVSILKKRNVCEDAVSTPATFEMQPQKPRAKRRVRFKVADDGYDQDLGSADSCLLLFLLCLVTVVISVGGTALYCAFGDAQSSVCQDFSRNADFYFGQIQHVITQIQHWFALGL
uniref:Consortin C-terminal domain-containing protein n=1 Tax=Gouania willdenowi TaxID=441366 RepID=A0A8C5N6P2_GOUWI